MATDIFVPDGIIYEQKIQRVEIQLNHPDVN